MGSAKVDKVPAKCIAKVCSDYSAVEKDCGAQAGCTWKKKVPTVAATYKCVSDAGNTAEKKTACEAVKDATLVKCIAAANGGSSCCKVAEKTKASGSPAYCAKKPSESGAVTAITSAFAAAAAALLM